MRVGDGGLSDTAIADLVTPVSACTMSERPHLVAPHFADQSGIV